MYLISNGYEVVTVCYNGDVVNIALVTTPPISGCLEVTEVVLYSEQGGSKKEEQASQGRGNS